MVKEQIYIKIDKYYGSLLFIIVEPGDPCLVYKATISPAVADVIGTYLFALTL